MRIYSAQRKKDEKSARETSAPFCADSKMGVPSAGCKKIGEECKILLDNLWPIVYYITCHTEGPLVKRLRHRPFTAVTGVRVS